MTSPTGRSFRLRHDSLAATLTEVGGGLRELRWDDRDLVVGFPDDRARPVYRGSVLAPWPNRIGDGTYTWAGEEHQLPLTEPARRTALHGLLCWTAFSPVHESDREVRLQATVWPQPGYPHRLKVTVGYALADDGLTWTVEAHNTGWTLAPYGCSIHPYLTAGAGRVDDWTLDLPAAQVVTVDPQRLLPTGLCSVGGTDLDLRGGRPLRGVELDHALTELPAGSSVTARLLDADGRGVGLVWDPGALPWVQVHTADRPEPELHRVGVAVEPMTCPPDAFSSGTGVLALAPGDIHRASWRIVPIEP